MISAILLTIETEEERNAVIKIFELYFPQMASKAADILKNEEDAKDAAMNVIQKIGNKPSDFLEYKSRETINKIICMTKNEAIDMYRRNKRRNDYLADIEELENYSDTEDEENICDFIVNQETQKMLAEAIKELDIKYQLVITMYYNRRMKNHEIAEELGIESSNVNVMLCRARKMLKKKILAKGYVR